MKKNAVLACLASIGFLLTLWGGSPVLAESFATTQITSNGVFDWAPAVSGDRLVWEGQDGSDYDLFTWTPADGIVQLTSNDLDDRYAEVSGDRAVWQGSDGNDLEVFTWTPADGVVQITSNDYDDRLPKVSGDRVVWQGSDGHDLEIFTWTPADGVAQLTSDDYDDQPPQVSGDRAVWQGSNGSDLEVFTWTPTDGVVQITSNDYDDRDPRVSGDRIAWVGWVAIQGEILTWTPTDGIVRLTNDETWDGIPQVSGDRIAWESLVGYNEIMTWTPTEGIARITTNHIHDYSPRVSGDRIVWYRYDGNDNELFTWTPTNGTVQVTSNDASDEAPRVSGDRIAWYMSSEVFTAVPAPPPTVSNLGPTSGPVTGGTEVTITGTDFAGLSGPGAVTFGGKNALDYEVNSPTEIVATAPAHAAGTVQVQVTTGAGSTPDVPEDDYEYVALPESPLQIHERVSVSSAEVQGDYQSSYPSINGDGRYVAFQSDADNLVASDTNEWMDVFVRDRATGTTERVSVASAGTEGDDESGTPSLSADGRYVGFVSYATDLVPGDTNNMCDVFVHDRQTGTTERVNVSSDEAQANDPGATVYVPWVSLSGDGRFVAFSSNSTNLVAGDTNGQWDIFVRDRQEGTTERVSVSTAGAQANSTCDALSISADGRYVAFDSAASTLVTGDTNGNWDVFVHDRQTHQTTRESVSGTGGQANDFSAYPIISADGRYVAFESYAANLVTGDNWSFNDVFVRDRVLQTTQRVSVSGTGTPANGDSGLASISADGRLVAFESYASNFVSGDTNGTWDVFVRDRTIGSTQRVSVSAAGAQSNNVSWQPALSGDGHYVAFGSDATNLVTGDTNGMDDIFVVFLRSYGSIRGSDRYDTAIRISKAMFPGTLPALSGLVVAPGETFPEALCGAPLATAWGGPVLLTYQSALANNVKAEMQRLAPAQVFCIGLSAAAVTQVIAALPGVTITAINGDGGSVYDMSYRVAKKLGERVDNTGGDISAGTAIVTIGTNFPDAIGVSPLACANLWPILLTDSGGNPPLHTKAAQAIAELGITKAIKVGTYATLPAGVDGLANLSGSDRYVTNAKVADWGKLNGGLVFTHTGLATGDKFPDALASGPYLAKDDGVLLLTPLTGPLPAGISALMTANRIDIKRFSYIAMIEPVIGQVKALLP